MYGNRKSLEKTYMFKVKDKLARNEHAHFHSSRDSATINEDLAVPNCLIKSGKILDIPLLDHIIIGRDGGSSLKLTNGYLWNK